jgi:hypothetical protein
VLLALTLSLMASNYAVCVKLVHMGYCNAQVRNLFAISVPQEHFRPSDHKYACDVLQGLLPKRAVRGVCRVLQGPILMLEASASSVLESHSASRMGPHLYKTVRVFLWMLEVVKLPTI